MKTRTLIYIFLFLTLLALCSKSFSQACLGDSQYIQFSVTAGELFRDLMVHPSHCDSNCGFYRGGRHVSNWKGLSDGEMFIGADGYFNWTPNQGGVVEDVVGQYYFSNILSLRRLCLSVVNHAPEFSNFPPPFGAEVGNLYQYTLLATDADDHVISYQLLGVPPEGMTIDAVTGQIQWTPAQEGRFSFVVSVSDEYGGNTTLTADVYAAPAPAPLPPPSVPPSPPTVGNQKTTFFHTDLYGSPVAATDSTGDVVWREEYQPYGGKTVNDINARSDALGFTGKPQDDSTGLVYMNARYYDPFVGRFMAMDPVGIDAIRPASFNRYAYANNNPYSYVDPDGRNPLFFLYFAAGALLATNNAQAPVTPTDIAPMMDTKTVDVMAAFSGVASGLRIVSTRSGVSIVDDVTKSGLREADNIANGPKLAQQLRLQSANSPFSKTGHLTDDAIKSSREIIPASAINNPAIPKGFSKYSTETFQSSSGNFQAHFYKNSKTGEVFYGNDYKVIFNSKSGG